MIPFKFTRLPLLIVFSFCFQTSIHAQTLPFLIKTHFNASISNTAMPYRLCLPLHYDTSKTYPLVLVLHGAGQRGADNQLQLELYQGATLWAQTRNQQLYPSFVLAPQCAKNKQWVNTPWAKGSYLQDTTKVSDQLLMAMDILTALQQTYKINAAKVYITGVSMGGYGTWDAITRYPKIFAKAIPICGAGDPSKAYLLIQMPLRVFHSSDDNVVPVSGSRDMVKAIMADRNNSRPTDWYTEYTNQGHRSWNKAYATSDLVSWMFSETK